MLLPVSVGHRRSWSCGWGRQELTGAGAARTPSCRLVTCRPVTAMAAILINQTVYTHEIAPWRAVRREIDVALL